MNNAVATTDETRQRTIRNLKAFLRMSYEYVEGVRLLKINLIKETRQRTIRNFKAFLRCLMNV